MGHPYRPSDQSRPLGGVFCCSASNRPPAEQADRVCGCLLCRLDLVCNSVRNVGSIRKAVHQHNVFWADDRLADASSPTSRPRGSRGSSSHLRSGRGAGSHRPEDTNQVFRRQALGDRACIVMDLVQRCRESGRFVQRISGAVIFDCLRGAGRASDSSRSRRLSSTGRIWT